MTKEELRSAIINRIKTSKHDIAYFTPIPSKNGMKEVISFHEEVNNDIGGPEDMITLNWPDTVTLIEITQELTPVRELNGAYTYRISELGL